MNKRSALVQRIQIRDGCRAFQKRAVDLDPESTNAHLYLAAAYASQYQPGGTIPPENRRIGERSDQGLRERTGCKILECRIWSAGSQAFTST